MKVYEIVKRVIAEEEKRAGSLADVYLARLKVGNPEAELAATMSKECYDNAAALRVVLEEMPVEIAGREV